jgi:histidinol-phosphate aminotransferase
MASRRSFLESLGRAAPWSAALVAARGREASAGAVGAGAATAAADPPVAPGIRLDSNENPLGPGPLAMEALARGFGDASRYPMNSRPSPADLREAVARRLSLRSENVALGAGSHELLRNAVRVFTSSSRRLVTAAPSFELPERMAALLGVAVRRVALDASLRLDLDRMAEAARWAGLVYVCNPNNPTSTVHSAKAIAELVARVRRDSPETAILVDEAYHEYVGDPGYATALPLALEHPNVFVTRTLSKAYGMAGLRIGYAVGQARGIEGLARWAMPYGQNVLGLAAAVAALGDTVRIAQERARNEEVRAFTVRVFERLGLRVADTQANFVFVETGLSATEFQQACARRGVHVGRPFPPLQERHARISLGTLDEMRQAAGVFRAVLGRDA